MYSRNYKNIILRNIDHGDLHFFEENMEAIKLPMWFTLTPRGKPIEYAYFIETGIAAIVASMGRGRDVEVGLIGFEGMTGAAAVLGNDCAPHECVMLMAGEGVRVPIATLALAVSRSPRLRLLLLRYTQTLYVQATCCALSNVRSRLEERLARLLLRCHDRVVGNTIPITHEVLAVMLGIQRPRVTLGLHILEGEGLIRANRGAIIVRHRDSLIRRARGSYGVPVAEYDRLIGVVPRRPRKTSYGFVPSAR
mgnify:CR=1 FL=1